MGRELDHLAVAGADPAATWENTNRSVIIVALSGWSDWGASLSLLDARRQAAAVGGAD